MGMEKKPFVLLSMMRRCATKHFQCKLSSLLLHDKSFSAVGTIKWGSDLLAL